MQNIRPAGSGRPAVCGVFVREHVAPLAAIVFIADGSIEPSDWPTSSASRLADSQLGHALGWVCEVRPNDLILVDPLGEGILKADLPDLSEEWRHQVRLTGSAAVFLVPAPAVEDRLESAEPGTAEWVEAVLQGHDDPIRAASVRTAISDAAGAPPRPGRNDPCHCGSGRKFKHCHGR